MTEQISGKHDLACKWICCCKSIAIIANRLIIANDPLTMQSQPGYQIKIIAPGSKARRQRFLNSRVFCFFNTFFCLTNVYSVTEKKSETFDGQTSNL